MNSGLYFNVQVPTQTPYNEVPTNLMFPSAEYSPLQKPFTTPRSQSISPQQQTQQGVPGYLPPTRRLPPISPFYSEQASQTLSFSNAVPPPTAPIVNPKNIPWNNECAAVGPNFWADNGLPPPAYNVPYTYGFDVPDPWVPYAFPCEVMPNGPETIDCTLGKDPNRWSDINGLPDKTRFALPVPLYLQYPETDLHPILWKRVSDTVGNTLFFKKYSSIKNVRLVAKAMYAGIADNLAADKRQWLSDKHIEEMRTTLWMYEHQNEEFIVETMLNVLVDFLTDLRLGSDEDHVAWLNSMALEILIKSGTAQWKDRIGNQERVSSGKGVGLMPLPSASLLDLGPERFQTQSNPAIFSEFSPSSSWYGKMMPPAPGRKFW